MTDNLKTTEIVDAAIAMISGAVLTYTPLIVQEGDLAFYVENPDPSLDLPAVFVKATRIVPHVPDLTGERIDTGTTLRIVTVDEWTDAEEVVDKRTVQAQEIAQLFIGAAGTRKDIGGASIAGYTIVQAVPVEIDLEPAESALLSFLSDRQVYATAVSVNVTGFSDRV